MDRCIPANPDISGIGVRTAIYAQNLLSFAAVVAHLWDRKVTNHEIKSMQVQSVGILSIAFAILISTVLQANAKTSSGQLITNFHTAIILDLSWMNNTSTFIWFLLYAHHRSKTEKEDEFIQPTWSDWTRVLLLLRDRLKEGEATRMDSVNQSGAKNDHEVRILPDMGHISNTLPWFIRRPWVLVSRAPVLTLGSIHLSFMAVIGIWLWSDPLKFGAPIPCDPTLAIVGNVVRFSSPALRISSLLLYSLLLIPGLNLAVPFLVFLAPHIIYNKSRKGYPQFRERCRDVLNTWRQDVRSLRRILQRIRRILAAVRGTQLETLSDAEAQASNIHLPVTRAAQSGQSPSPSSVHTASLVGGLVCLLAINIIFLVDIELTLSRNRPSQIQGEGVWGFGQVLALLLLVVPLRDFLTSILEIRQRVMEERRSQEVNQKKFEESLRRAIEDETLEGYDFQDLIERGADPNTQIRGMITYP